MSNPPQKKQSQAEYLRLREAEIKLQEGLPHLYGWKWYPWAREFFESENKTNLLCAANQVSKSSTQIRKLIDWATNPAKWGKLWPSWRKGEPIQFWYLYPSRDVVKAEFEMKWKQFLPNGDFKNHPLYGWKEEWASKELYAIHFNSGAHIFFKTYAQNVACLQTGTCHGIFCDEELPVELYDELIFRLSASDGYFHMVFTATLGQEFWRLAMDPGPKETELLPTAFKQTISMYDCLLYEDGTPSHWSLNKIKMVEGKCSTHNEILKRVHGKFIVTAGRMYPTFDLKRHLRPRFRIPRDWNIYAGVDIGSGGENGHPAAICFVAVRPDYRMGRVFSAWRGDDVVTSAGDVFLKYQEMRDELKIEITQKFYDWSSRDFDIIATRAGDPFMRADKAHERGQGVLNTLFKNDMLLLEEDEQVQKLASELSTLKEGGDKRKAKDDLVDALRYAASGIQWDFSAITGALPEGYEEPKQELTEMEQQMSDRRKDMDSAEANETLRIEDEFAEANEMYET